MPTYVRKVDGEVVERVVTETGSHADRERARIAAGEGSSWSVQSESVEEATEPSAAVPEGADAAEPAGRPPRNPRSRSTASETNGES